MGSHGRYVTFQLAEVAVPRELFRKTLSLIDDLRPRPARKRMAQWLSVDEGTLTHWEKGRRVPRGEQLKLVESLLDRMLILSFYGRYYTT